MYAGSKYESHYTVWTAWISIRVRVRVGVYFILQNLAPPGTTDYFLRSKKPGGGASYSGVKRPGGDLLRGAISSVTGRIPFFIALPLRHRAQSPPTVVSSCKMRSLPASVALLSILVALSAAQSPRKLRDRVVAQCASH